MIWLRFAPYIAAGVLALALWGTWQYAGRLKDQRDAAVAALETEMANEKVVTKYVDRIVKIPGPPVIRERLVSGVCGDKDGVPGAGHSDAAAGADAGNRQPDFAEGLARDLAAAQRNRAKLEALQDVLKPQVDK